MNMDTDTAGPLVLYVAGPSVARADVPELCDRLRLLYGSGTDEVVCDVGALTRPDLSTVEALARLRLTARRAGGRLRLRNAGPGLMSLLELTGLGP